MLTLSPSHDCLLACSLRGSLDAVLSQIVEVTHTVAHESRVPLCTLLHVLGLDGVSFLGATLSSIERNVGHMVAQGRGHGLEVKSTDWARPETTLRAHHVPWRIFVFKVPKVAW